MTLLRLLAALAFINAVPLLAQPAPSGASFSRSLTFEAGGATDTEIRDEAGRAFDDIAVRHFGVAVGQRLRLGGATAVSLEVRYDDYGLRSDASLVPLPKDAQVIAAQVSVRQPINERWSFLGSLKPTFANTGDLFDDDGLGLSVGALALYRQSETFTWAFGLLYRTPADDLQWIPAVGFDWRPSPGWTLTLGYPRSAVSYEVNPRVRVALAAVIHGGTFHVEEEPDGRPSNVPSLRDSLLDYTEVRVGLGLDYRPSPALELTALLGAIVHQEFDYYERGYRLKADDPAPFATIGARLLF